MKVKINEYFETIRSIKGNDMNHFFVYKVKALKPNTYVAKILFKTFGIFLNKLSK